MSTAFIDTDELYLCLFIVLHPSYKLTYFRTNGWPAGWITTASEKTRQWFDHGYNPLVIASTESLPVNSKDKRSKKSVEATLFEDETNKLCTEFFDFGNTKKPSAIDQLAQYLAEPVIAVPIDNVIKWWTGQLGTYPALAQFALDMHSIPGK